MGNTHAYLSASSAERWIHCPGSARLAALYPEKKSPAADEGSLAHEVGRILIEYNAGDLTRAEMKKQLAKVEKQVDAFYADHKDMTGSFDAMVRIIEPYATYVWSEFQKAKKADPAAVLMCETRVAFDEYVPKGFGTSDVVIIGNGKAMVIDLKYGKGVPVSAVNNPQIRLYALGAIAEFELLYDFDAVKVVIYQPRLDSVTEQELTVQDLKDWAETIVKPAAEEAAGDGARICPGPWCDDHFCPARSQCKIRAQWVLELEEFAVKDPDLLTDDELGEILPRLQALGSFQKKVENYAIDALSRGIPIKGWKLVEGMSRRKYKDEDQVAQAVLSAGYEEALIYERSLLGITKMTDLLGKKKFNEILGDLIEKPQGAPKLAPESDPKPAFTPKVTDFDDD
ncbi:MAG: DUF2800 domain-containing protein [Oscillospiraceae bacterium]|nr:DUF2800 domain-containing protein [Oscillospiraceae bacterium]MBR3236864.1 DUF2800 domain-containing protein [Oscillospiraceae bacterium]